MSQDREPTPPIPPPPSTAEVPAPPAAGPSVEDPSRPPRVNYGKLALGLVALASGLLLALERLSILSFNLKEAWDWVPLIVVAIGVFGLTQGGSPEGRKGGWTLIAVGAWLLISLQGLWGFHFGSSWPLLLIFLGAVRMIDPVGPEGRPKALWLLGLGAFFLVLQTGFLGLGFRNAWPLLLIFAGIAITWSALIRPDRRRSGAGCCHD